MLALPLHYTDLTHQVQVDRELSHFKLMQCKRRRLRQCLFTRRYQLHQATSQLHVAWETHTTTLTENPSFLNCLSTFSRCLYKFPSYLHGSQSTAIKYHPLASSFSIHHQKGLEAVGTGRYTTDPVMHVSVMPVTFPDWEIYRHFSNIPDYTVWWERRMHVKCEWLPYSRSSKAQQDSEKPRFSSKVVVL